MGKTVLKTKQGIINALRKDVKILQIYFHQFIEFE